MFIRVLKWYYFRTMKKAVKIYIDEKYYQELKRIAEEKGVSVPKVIVNIIAENLGDEGQGVLAERVKELEAKYKQLFIEVGRMERDLALLRKRDLRDTNE